MSMPPNLPGHPDVVMGGVHHCRCLWLHGIARARKGDLRASLDRYDRARQSVSDTLAPLNPRLPHRLGRFASSIDVGRPCPSGSRESRITLSWTLLAAPYSSLSSPPLLCRLIEVITDVKTEHRVAILYAMLFQDL